MARPAWTPGTTLLELARAAERLGFRARGVHVEDPADLEDEEGRALLPAIAHWDGNHFVVLYEVDARQAVVGDPAQGLRRIPRAELPSHWNGILLLLEPTEALHQPRTEPAAPSRRPTALRRFVHGMLRYRALLAQLLLAAQVAVTAVRGAALFALSSGYSMLLLTRFWKRLLALPHPPGRRRLRAVGPDDVGRLRGGAPALRRDRLRPLRRGRRPLRGLDAGAVAAPQPVRYGALPRERRGQPPGVADARRHPAPGPGASMAQAQASGRLGRRGAGLVALPQRPHYSSP